MPFKKTLSLILLILFSLSCVEDTTSCATTLCPGLPVIGLEVLLDGENVFLNETYTEQDVSLTGTSSDEIDFGLASLDSSSENSILFLGARTFSAENFQFTVNIGDEFTIDIAYATEVSLTGECCSEIPFLQEVQINGVQQEFSNTSVAAFTVNLN